MAERRMIAKTIIDSDAFLDMSISARLLYYDLSMRADDDGFVNAPKKIMRMVGASEDDLRMLCLRKFIIPFDNGVVVIKHWRIHNYIRKDTYSETPYKEQKAMLEFDENNAYRMKTTSDVLPVNDPSTARQRDVDAGKDRLGQDRIGKDRLGQDRIGESAELQAAPALSIILNDGTEYDFSQEYVDQMQKLYPAVDVMAEMLKMKAWCINNPKRRKTRRGITSFVGNWLSKEQDKGGIYKESARQGGKKQNTTFMDIYERRQAEKNDGEGLQ